MSREGENVFRSYKLEIEALGGNMNGLENLINETYELSREGSQWQGKRYEKINDLQNDYSGKIGERLLENACLHAGIPVFYGGDKISTDGTYDIMIKNKKVEVKTARYGNSKIPSQRNFQHENLRSDEDCDYYAFVDIKPESFYITIIPKKGLDFTKMHPIMRTTPHNRRETSNQYKWDFSNAAIKRGIEAGITTEVTGDNMSLLADILDSRIK